LAGCDDPRAVGIQIAARISELRHLAERTARDYEADIAIDNPLSAEHRRLRRMLLALAAALASPQVDPADHSGMTGSPRSQGAR
jgi:hypothetical protein